MTFARRLRPGQGFLLLTVWRKEAALTATGRPTTGQYVSMGSIYGIITRCGLKEIEQSKQAGHPVTHTVVQSGAKLCAKPTDILEVKSNKDTGESRFFYVQTTHDPVEVGHFTVYQVLERGDLQHEHLGDDCPPEGGDHPGGIAQ